MAINLPLELILYILELSGRESLRMGPILMCLSSYIHDIISPLIYQEIVVYMYRGLKTPSKEAIQRYGQHIRYLLVGWGIEEAPNMLTVYLTSSPNIIHLGIWTGENFRLDNRCLDLLKRLPLIRLSIHPQIFKIPFGETMSMQRRREVESLLSAFPQLTHLDLTLELPVSAHPFLTVLPNLTYLSMHPPHARPWNYPDLRKECPGLKALIFVDQVGGAYDYEEGREDMSNVKDSRAISCRVPMHIENWKKGARGQRDSFTFALERLHERASALGKA